MALKENITVRVSGSDVIDYTAVSNFTTDVIEWESLNGFTLNVWFSVITGTNPTPTLTIEASNENNNNAFVTYTNMTNISLPELFEDISFKPKYLRFSYVATGVGLGSVVTFTLNEIKP